jgi:outer membrane protein OmpA-like peptidoglycan-associated protein
MKHYLGLCFGLLLAGYSCLAVADDMEKIRELEHAMTAPAAEITKKPRTRAIVFDPTPEAASSSSGDCSVVPPDARLTVVDFTIQFKLGSAEIASSSDKVLHEIAKVLALSSKCVIVEGHTDATGNADRNNALSRDRADAVVNYISDKAGLDKKRLIPVGKGSSEPLKNLDPRNPQNRRVVFKVVG